MTHRFTVDGSDALEQQLNQLCQRFTSAVQTVIPVEVLEGLMLAGGYGRGEGGVLHTAEGDHPYNDLDFYVFLKGNLERNRRRFQATLERVAHHFSQLAKIEIEICLLSRPKLEQSPVTMFYYDLAWGHHWLVGDDTLLERCQHHKVAQEIPLAEATRLLMNRCSGLLFAKERLLHDPFTPDDADFVQRNFAKAQLAFGDTLLAASGQYHWSCRTRHERVLKLLPTGEMPWLNELQNHHRAGLEFKLQPFRSSAPADELSAQLCQFVPLGFQVWLWIERCRLRGYFTSPEDYALRHINKCPDTKPWRNRLINLNAFGARAALSAAGGRHPRERLLHALTFLLWTGDRIHRPRILHELQDELGTTASDFPTLVNAYAQLWRRFG